MAWSPARALRRRRMLRRLRELDRLDAAYGVGVAPPRPRRARSRSRSREWLPYVITPVVLIGIAFMVPGGLPVEVRRLVGLGPERLAPPVTATTSGAHAFMHQVPGSDRPAAWDPCKPLRYQINPDGGPDNAVALVQEAVEVTARLTGLHFEYVGTTDARPQWDRPFVPTFRTSRKPALVSWANAEEVPALGGDVAGVGGAAAVENDHGRTHLLGGGVTLDIDAFRQMAGFPDPQSAQRSVIMHELGHLVGLAHVEDEGELMQASGGAREFGPGDREGLAILGRGECS